MPQQSGNAIIFSVPVAGAVIVVLGVVFGWRFWRRRNSRLVKKSSSLERDRCTSELRDLQSVPDEAPPAYSRT